MTLGWVKKRTKGKKQEQVIAQPYSLGSRERMQTAGYQTFTPNLLSPKRKQFSALEANESRRVFECITIYEISKPL